MRHIIFVCTGNICRSAMAEGILKARWALNAGEGRVSSIGIHGLNHQPASELARQLCEEHGIDISQHLSRPLGFDELNRADLIFTMEMVQKDFILLFLPHLVDRVFLLGAWPEKDAPKYNIRDPIGGGMKEYRQAYDAISHHIDRILPFLPARLT